MKKRFFAFLLLALVALSVALPALASSGGFVIDEYDVLSEARFSELNERAGQLKERYGFTVMFVITGDAGADGITAHIRSVYTRQNGDADGLILGHDCTNDRIGGESFGRGRELFPSDSISELLDTYNEAETYAGGIIACLDEIESVLEAHIAATPAPVRSGYDRVEDEGGLLNEAQRAELSRLLTDISQRHDCDVVLITAERIPSSYRDVRVFAADRYEALGYSMESGMVMLHSPAERDYAFIATGSAEQALTPDALARLEHVVVDKLKEDDFYGAYVEFANNCDDFLTRAENGKPFKNNLISPAFAGIAAVVVGLLAGAGVTGSMAAKLKSVRFKANASDYVRKNSLHLTHKSEVFLYSNVTKTAIPKDTDSGSRSGGSSGSFSSSSGSSWSGSSGKY